MAFFNRDWFYSPSDPWCRFRSEANTIVNNININCHTAQERKCLDTPNNKTDECSAEIFKQDRHASEHPLKDVNKISRKLFHRGESINANASDERNNTVHELPSSPKSPNYAKFEQSKESMSFNENEYSMANITELSDEGLFSDLLYDEKGGDDIIKSPGMKCVVEFALDCTIENCECHENWDSKKMLIQPMDFSGDVLNTARGRVEKQVYRKKSSNNWNPCFVCIDSPCCCQDNEWAPFVRTGMVRKEQTSVNDETENATTISITSTDDSDEYDEGSNFNKIPHAAHDAYEVVSWDAASNREFSHFVMNSKLNNEYRNGVQDSPQLDLSGLDGYHTAPSTPSYDSNDYIIIDRTDSEDSTNTILTNHSTNASLKAMSESSQCHDSCNNHALCFPLESFSADMANSINSIDDDGTGHRDSQNNACTALGRPEEATQTLHNLHTSTVLAQSRIRLPMPPYIDATSIQYEGNPSTGEILVVGKGSFGVVYKAQFSDPAFFHLPIVVKEFDEEYSNCKEIIQEAQRLFYLKDTRYVPICYGILTYGENDKQKYGIVQEYVGTGLTLEELLWEQYNMPFEYWLIIAYQCCEGLAMFHEKGILLNDIKSNNILLEFNARSVRIRYIDFGLATDMTGKRYKNTKSLENFVYLAPEVRRYGESTTIASDIFSLGYMLEQIRRTSGVFELTVVSRLCMDRDPTMRLPVRGAMSLISETMEKLGYAEYIM
ncbi:serine/threonine-protein kinase pakB-like [Dreissena polymorpha]|uniref:Protein kinase domain-containing protein n=1 Tax=Dreissena polymorpha TaxID=45954 RepID=A0A9D4CDT3_DREPO|nr:serine/threonine-protein kinase pakB-like [Dreissena polymorpha]KAH3722337.1 hypothetical protein DPMN_065295 [Dreissena polymorpha]